MLVCPPPPVEGHKEVSDPLDLEVEMLVSCHVVLETDPSSFVRTESYLSL